MERKGRKFVSPIVPLALKWLSIIEFSDEESKRTKLRAQAIRLSNSGYSKYKYRNNSRLEHLDKNLIKLYKNSVLDNDLLTCLNRELFFCPYLIRGSKRNFMKMRTNFHKFSVNSWTIDRKLGGGN